MYYILYTTICYILCKRAELTTAALYMSKKRNMCKDNNEQRKVHACTWTTSMAPRSQTLPITDPETKVPHTRVQSVQHSCISLSQFLLNPRNLGIPQHRTKVVLELNLFKSRVLLRGLAAHGLKKTRGVHLHMYMCKYIPMRVCDMTMCKAWLCWH